MHHQKSSLVSASALYLGGGLTESQLLWIMPIAVTICRNRKLSQVIFEFEPSQQLSSSIGFKSAARYNIDVFCIRKLPTFDLSVHSIFHRIKRRIIAIPLTFLCRRCFLLKIKDWTLSQIIHSVWDSSFIGINDGSISPTFASLYFNTVESLLYYDIAKYLVASQVNTAIMGHSTYQYRAMKAKFDKMPNIDKIYHAGGTLFRMNGADDTSYNRHEKPEWTHLFANQVDTDLNLFRINRTRGVSSYADAQTAMSLPRLRPDSYSAKNYIFLHVFRDSPFHCIDQTRIFADYVEWLISTLSILRESSENWIIRMHPSALKWGERQDYWIDSVVNELEWSSLPKHISIDKSSSSTLDILENAQRIVTYSGSVALEACCYGIRPITISNSSASSCEQAIVLKPNSRQVYRNLLLASSDNPIFHLNENQISLAWKALYATECQLSLNPQVGHLPVYRSDSNWTKQQDFLSVYNILSSSQDLPDILDNIGNSICSNLESSMIFV
jgi:hypothetical protein